MNLPDVKPKTNPSIPDREPGASSEAVLRSRETAVSAREFADGARESAATLREEAVRAREDAAQSRSELDALMARIRDANEHLIVANLRSQVLAEEADRANRLKDEFIALVSHELRTPLNAVLGWARVLASKQVTEDRARHAIQSIERNAASLTIIIDDLLDVSRIVAGTLKLRSAHVDLVAVAQEACDVARPAAASKRIDLRLSVEGSFTGIVIGDAARLQQAIGNLLANAIKFTPDGGSVHVSVERVGAYMEVTIADTGRGISPDFMPHVFERFRQADSITSRSHGGLGLGLAIVRQLVELHEGTVHAASQGEGRGATFTIRLPVHAVLAPAERRPAPGRRPAVPTEPAQPRARLDGVHVLVVDNDADGRMLTSLLLTDLGARVSAVASARSARQALEGERPDVLVSDIGMPEEDGYDLIRQIRQHESERGGFLPAIALTGYACADDRDRILEAGFQAHVPKPLDAAELTAAVAALAACARGASPTATGSDHEAIET